MRGLLGDPVDQGPVVFMRPFDRDLQRLGQVGGSADVIDMAMGQDDLLDRHALFLMAAWIRSMSPPGSTTVPRMVAGSQISEQFC